MSVLVHGRYFLGIATNIKRAMRIVDLGHRGGEVTDPIEKRGFRI